MDIIQWDVKEFPSVMDILLNLQETAPNFSPANSSWKRKVNPSSTTSQKCYLLTSISWQNYADWDTFLGHQSWDKFVRYQIKNYLN